MTRFPTPGLAKTRLSPVLGERGAAELSSALTLRCIRRMHLAAASKEFALEIRYTGATEEQMRRWVGRPVQLRAQVGNDLGQRLSHAIRTAFAENAPAAIVVGSDAPGLGGAHIRAALDALKTADVVLGPAKDGGYYLAGVRASAASQALPALLGPHIPWSTSRVLRSSITALEHRGITPVLLDTLSDVDRPEDLSVWQCILSLENRARSAPTISVVIPALNEAATIAEAVESAREAGAHEVIVSDGGSRDETMKIAMQATATVVSATAGRASQLNTGARMATGDVLVFLHADACLPQDAAKHIQGVLRNPEVVLGAFRFEVGDQSLVKDRLITSVGRMRHRVFKLPYGDQAQFLRRRDFEDLGGLADMPVMEDYEFAMRCKRAGLLQTAGVAAPASARAWHEHGLVRVTLLYMTMIAGFRLGVPVERLAGLQARISSRGQVAASWQADRATRQ